MYIAVGGRLNLIHKSKKERGRSSCHCKVKYRNKWRWAAIAGQKGGAYWAMVEILDQLLDPTFSRLTCR